MNPYKGNGKPFVYVYFPPDEKERALSILEKFVQKNGNVSFWWSEKPLKKPEKVIDAAFSVIAFFKQAQINDKDFQNVIDAAVRCEKKILPIHLEETEYNTPWSRLALGSKQGIIRSAYKDDEQLLEKMTGAETFVDMKVTARQKKNRRSQLLRIIGGLLASALGIVGVLFFTGVIGFDPGDEEQIVELPAFGISGTQEELDKITTLCTYGDQGVTTEWSEDEWSHVRIGWFLGNFDAGLLNSSGSMEYKGNPIGRGETSDLSGLEYLRNLEVLVIEGQRITDISPVCKLKKVKYLSMRCNLIESLAGIEEMESLEKADFRYNKLLDVSSLFRCPNITKIDLALNPYLTDLGCDYAPNVKTLNIFNTKVTKAPVIGVGLKNVSFSGEFSDVTDYSFLSQAASFDYLSLSGSVKSTLLPALKDKSVNDLLWKDESDLVSMQELADSGVIFAGEYGNGGLIMLRQSQLQTLDGIENVRGKLIFVYLIRNLSLEDTSAMERSPGIHFKIEETEDGDMNRDW